MHRFPSSILAVVVLALGVLGTSCSVFANTTAATVGDREVSIESVQALALDEGFVGDTTDVTESAVPGELFRSLLAYEIQRVAWVAEAERWGLEITDADLAAARDQVLPQIEAGGVTYDSSTVDAIVESVAAQSALEEHFAQLDPEDDTVLRRFYEGLPDEYWDQLCIAVVQLDAAQSRDARVALADGVTIEDLPNEVDGAQLVADPVQQCIPEQQLDQQLLDVFLDATVGETTGPVSIDDGAGGEVLFAFRVDERRHVDFEGARQDLAGIAGQLTQQGPTQWISVIVSNAEVDPRFGSDVQMGANGQPTVVAPPVPLSITPDLSALLGAGADPGA